MEDTRAPPLGPFIKITDYLEAFSVGVLARIVNKTNRL